MRNLFRDGDLNLSGSVAGGQFGIGHHSFCIGIFDAVFSAEDSDGGLTTH